MARFTNRLRSLAALLALLVLLVGVPMLLALVAGWPLPRRAPDWITQAFLPTKTAHIEPGTYTIEVWANPSELTPSTNPSVPADANERNCSVEVEVTAGTHLNVFVNDIPTEGGECPHETDIRKGP